MKSKSTAIPSDGSRQIPRPFIKVDRPQPTDTDVLACMHAAFGPDVARLMDWTIRATVEAVLRRERRSVTAFCRSLESTLQEVVPGNLKDANMLGQIKGAQDVNFLLGKIAPREIVEEVANRFDAVARRKAADIRKLA